ncbi:hypothetical protein V1511DRAFT_204114 [Dipodascopsis uninucleata]
MSTKPKVLIVADVTETNKVYEDFQSKFECINYKITTKEKLLEDLKTKYNDIRAIWAMWLGFVELGFIVEDDIQEAFPDSVDVIALASVGYDRFNIDLLTRKGIKLCNSPANESQGVAEIALHLMLSTFRYTSLYEHLLREKKNLGIARYSVDTDMWIKGMPKRQEGEAYSLGHNIGGRPSHSLKNRVCGIFGMGSIGREIAKRAFAFDMKVHYYTRTPLSEKVSVTHGLCLASMTAHSTIEELFKACDVLVLCVPLTPQTSGVVNTDSIRIMKPGVKIVNVGRGRLVNIPDLVEALDSGHVSAAGLDVYPDEPHLPEDLVNRWDVTLLPHIGSSTQETNISAENICMKNIEDIVLNGGPGISPVN